MDSVSGRNKVNLTQIERNQIAADAKENIKGDRGFFSRGISWMGLGFSNYCKSWVNEDYRAAVREVFFQGMKEALSEGISASTEEKPRIVSQRLADIMAIPEGDMSKARKMELILREAGDDMTSLEAKEASLYFRGEKNNMMDVIDRMPVGTWKDDADKAEAQRAVKNICGKFEDTEIKSQEDLEKFQENYIAEIIQAMIKQCGGDAKKLDGLGKNVGVLFEKKPTIMVSDDKKDALLKLVKDAREYAEVVAEEKQTLQTLLEGSVGNTGGLQVEIFQGITKHVLESKFVDPETGKEAAKKILSSLTKLNDNPIALKWAYVAVGAIVYKYSLPIEGQVSEVKLDAMSELDRLNAYHELGELAKRKGIY